MYLLYAKLHNKILFPRSVLNYDHDYRLDAYEEELKQSIDESVTVQEYNVETDDHILINCVIFNNPTTENTVIFSHGNGGRIDECLFLFRILGSIASVVVYDYRGYGKSTGEPTEKGLYTDIETVYNFLIEKYNKDPSKITLFGFSLGCAPTTKLAKKLCKKNKAPKSVIIQSGFSSLKDVVKENFSSVLSSCVIYEFDNCKNIEKITCPILLSHSPYDEVVNINNKDRLIERNPSIEFYQLSGYHNSLDLEDSAYFKKIESFIN